MIITQEIDGIKFRLKTPHDLSFIGRYGRVFTAIDGTGSGCICFGVDGGDKKCFIKIAGADTVEAECMPAESVELLKSAALVYSELRHPSLIRILEHYEYGDCYAAVFEWTDGEGLFDHWNFEKYKSEGIIPPGERFKHLPAGKRISATLDIVSFFEMAADKGYIGCDFYDGSLIYDFKKDKLTVCDIDLFRKAPVINRMGEDYWGTKRLKAPEEYEMGAEITQTTNVFTLGALFFDMFGLFTDEDIRSRYRHSEFTPCPPDRWTLSEDVYSVLLKAVSPNRKDRYQTMREFAIAYRKANERYMR